MATIPTVHLNGTGFTNLRDGYAAAYSQARAERDAAFAKLRAAHEYVGEMLAGICDQKR